mmetsp:Transcript_4235/g.4984  ORF Transcript_4235/g.4984 Transcript_4235/m.4984 type:complete len:105 (+) Transcript_4235:299-613(+)
MKKSDSCSSLILSIFPTLMNPSNPTTDLILINRKIKPWNLHLHDVKVKNEQPNDMISQRIRNPRGSVFSMMHTRKRYFYNTVFFVVARHWNFHIHTFSFAAQNL